MSEERLNHIKRILEEHKIVEVLFLGESGSGKTLLIDRTLMGLDLKCAVIVGGCAPHIDAEHLKNLCAACVSVPTKESGCLEPSDIEKALKQLPLDDLDLIFIEGSGGLSASENYSLGEDHRVLMSDYAAGSELPFKHPGIFSSVDAVALTKVDLKAAIDFDEVSFWDEVTRLNPHARRLRLSSVSGEGLSYWIKMFYDWRDAKKNVKSENVPTAEG